MRRRTVFTTLITLLFLTIGSSVAFGQAQPPGPVIAYQLRAAGLPQAARFNITQNIQNFEPGAATAFHTHPARCS